MKHITACLKRGNMAIRLKLLLFNLIFYQVDFEQSTVSLKITLL